MGHHAYHSLPFFELVTGPEGFGSLAAVQNHTERFAVIFQQENLARLDFHVIYYHCQCFVQDFIQFERGGKGGSDIVQQR